MRILIVEDDLRLLNLFSKVLADEAHQIDRAATLHAAETMLKAHAYDLCLLDVQLGMDTTLDLLANFRKLQPEPARVAVISSREDVRAYCEELGITFKRKPITKEDLLLLVNME
jgi:two-component system, NtrC family, response regulator AlgB